MKMMNAYKGKNLGIENPYINYYDVNIKTYKLLEKVACKFFYLSQCSVKNIPVCFAGDVGAVPTFATIIIGGNVEAKNLKVFIKQ